jgi:bacillithiol system protein YtxJ
MNWIEIKDASAVNTLKLESAANPGHAYVIFKHSTRCITSRTAKNLFESEWSASNPVYLINVVEFREASNSAATLFGVHHESPQVLVIQNGKCVYDNSHSMIDATEVIRLLQSEPTG